MVWWEVVSHAPWKVSADGKLGKIHTVMAEYPQGWLTYEGEWGAPKRHGVVILPNPVESIVWLEL